MGKAVFMLIWQKVLTVKLNYLFRSAQAALLMLVYVPGSVAPVRLFFCGLFCAMNKGWRNKILRLNILIREKVCHKDFSCSGCFLFASPFSLAQGWEEHGMTEFSTVYDKC